MTFISRKKSPQLYTDTVWMGLAKGFAVNGECTRDRVAALLVDTNDNLLVSAFNAVDIALADKSCLEGGCPRGRKSYEEQPRGGDYSDCLALHAEVRAMDSFITAFTPDFYPGEVPQTTMYVTRTPCDAVCWPAITEFNGWFRTHSIDFPVIGRVAWATGSDDDIPIRSRLMR